MKKILLLLTTVLLTGILFSQSLSNLTPEQLEMYKMYKSQSASGSTTYTGSSEQNEDNIERSNPLKKTTTLDKNEQYYLSKEDTVLIEDKEFFDWLKKRKDGKKTLKIYGASLFKNQKLQFEPKLNLPTPPNYLLGTYDELILDISGLYDATYRLKISPDGTIRVPGIGLIKVGGQTIETASTLIKNRLTKIYSGISSGETIINLALGNIRSIRILVIGEAFQPGTYTLPSLATAFTALYSCGGPNENGSLRAIKVIRRGKVIATIDLYKFLEEGIMANNISLQDEDVVKIEPYQNRITLQGAVKNEAIFESIKGETLEDLIRIAGGYTEDASKLLITAIRNTLKEKTVVDIREEMIPTFLLHSGDEFTVTKIYDKYDNRVEINGAILRPGSYALDPGLTLKQLLTKADGITEKAYLDRAIIYRRSDNSIPEMIGFDLNSVLDGKGAEIILQKNDSVHISEVVDFQLPKKVSIWGEVKEPGVFETYENLTIKDLIFKAKGLTEMASTDSIELIRIIKEPLVLSGSDQKSKIYRYPIGNDFDISESQQHLEDGDQVIVRSISGVEKIRMVKVEGEVISPGSYNIINKTERLSDVLKRAGGITRFAYAGGAYLIRYEQNNYIEGIIKKNMVDNAKRQIESENSTTVDAKKMKDTGINNIDQMKKALTGTKSVDQLLKEESIIGINLKGIIDNPGSLDDLYLEEGDVLYVPRELQTVRILGEVLFPTYVGYGKSLSLKYYIGRAGGFNNNAQRNKTFVLYANGTAESTKSFLGIKKYPPIKPGSNIIVPEKPTNIKDKMSTAETVSILGSIATVATLIISVFR